MTVAVAMDTFMATMKQQMKPIPPAMLMTKNEVWISNDLEVKVYTPSMKGHSMNANDTYHCHRGHEYFCEQEERVSSPTHHHHWSHGTIRHDHHHRRWSGHFTCDQLFY